MQMERMDNPQDLEILYKILQGVQKRSWYPQ